MVLIQSDSDSSDGAIIEDENDKILEDSVHDIISTLIKEDLTNNGDLDVFLLTYRQYSSATFVLQDLIARFRNTENDNGTKTSTTQFLIINFICTWISRYPDDFTHQILQLVKSLFETLTNRHTHQHLAASIAQTLQQRHVVPTIIHSMPTTHKSSLLELPSLEFARQLTLVDFEIYSSIKAEEFVGMNWQKHKFKAPNICRIIKHCNTIIGWVSESIVVPDSAMERARIKSWFIEVAKHLIELRNFNTHMYIMAGLLHGAVYRLRKTTALLSKEILATFTDLTEFGAPNRAFMTLRNAQAAAQFPCLYYLGTALTDLTFIYEGNPELVDGKINFENQRRVHKVISIMMSCTKVPFPFAPNRYIASLLRNIQHTRDDTELYHLSFEREPRIKRQ